jgi:hypothetical protein
VVVVSCPFGVTVNPDRKDRKMVYMLNEYDNIVSTIDTVIKTSLNSVCEHECRIIKFIEIEFWCWKNDNLPELCTKYYRA